jgi:hypothetical protein
VRPRTAKKKKKNPKNNLASFETRSLIPCLWLWLLLCHQSLWLLDSPSPDESWPFYCPSSGHLEVTFSWRPLKSKPQRCQSTQVTRSRNLLHTIEFGAQVVLRPMTLHSPGEPFATLLSTIAEWDWLIFPRQPGASARCVPCFPSVQRSISLPKREHRETGEKGTLGKAIIIVILLVCSFLGFRQ